MFSSNSHAAQTPKTNDLVPPTTCRCGHCLQCTAPQISADVGPSEDIANRSIEVPLMQMQSILEAPEFVAARSTGDDRDAARFWMSMTALYTGARASELMHMTIWDLRYQGDTWMLRLGPSQSGIAMSPYRGRWLPVHEELVRCGFLTYAAQQQLHGHIYLFGFQSEPYQRPPSPVTVNRWLSRLTQSRGFTMGRNTLVAMRHVFIIACLRSNMPRDFVELVVGHGGRATSTRSFFRVDLASDATNDWTAEYMARLRLVELDVSHLYVDKLDKDVDAALGPVGIRAR